LRCQGPAGREYKAVLNPDHEFNALLREFCNSLRGGGCDGTDLEAIYNLYLILVICYKNHVVSASVSVTPFATAFVHIKI